MPFAIYHHVHHHRKPSDSSGSSMGSLDSEEVMRRQRTKSEPNLRALKKKKKATNEIELSHTKIQLDNIPDITLNDEEEFIEEREKSLRKNVSVITLESSEDSFGAHYSRNNSTELLEVVTRGTRSSFDSSGTDSANLLDGISKESVHDEEPIEPATLEKSWYSEIVSKTIAIWQATLPHILLMSNLVLFGGFFILSPHAMKIVRPIPFGVFRLALIIVSLFPLMLYFDRKYTFRSNKNMKRRKANYAYHLSTFSKENVFLHTYHKIVYQLFYDNRIVEIVWARIPKIKQAKRFALCGLLIILNQVTFLTGYYLTNATVSGSISPLCAVITCVLSMIIGNEPKSILKLIGVVIAVCGAIAMILTTALLKEKSFSTLVSDPLSDNDPLHHYNPMKSLIEGLTRSDSSSVGFGFVLGLLALVLSTTMNALYLLATKKLLNKGVPPITVTFWGFLFGYPLLVFICLFFKINYRRFDWSTIIGLLYAGIPFGSFQFMFQSKASSMTTPTMVGIYSTISPAVGLITGLSFLGESTSPYVLLGASFIVGGVVFVLIARWRETHQKAATSENQVVSPTNASCNK